MGGAQPFCFMGVATALTGCSVVSVCTAGDSRGLGYSYQGLVCHILDMVCQGTCDRTPRLEGIDIYQP